MIKNIDLAEALNVPGVKPLLPERMLLDCP